MKKESQRKDVVLYFLIVSVALFVISAYFFIEKPDFWRESFLVGDSVCGSFNDEEAQDNCCAEGHKGDIAADCLGDWIYLNPERNCQFVCEGAEPVCTEDAKICDNGIVVSRNASLECEFNPCP